MTESPASSSAVGFISCFAPFCRILINPKHEPALLADKIEWAYFENEFKEFYSEKPSRPAMPSRLMVGVLMLKHLYSLGDEKIPFAWESNPYFQPEFGIRNSRLQLIYYIKSNKFVR
jgi:hypothetical protein